MTDIGDRLALSPEDLRRVDLVNRLAGRGAVDDLVAMLGDPSWTVRRAVVAALAASGSSTVAPLSRVLRHERDDETRIAATVDALSAAVGEIDATLAAMALDAEVPVLADIAQILGRRRTASALPTLVLLSRHADDNVAVAAIEALGRIGGRAAVDSLVDAVQSGNFFRAFPAIDVLGRSGDPRAVAPLKALLEQPQYVAEAARALGRTGDAAAVAPLMRLVARSAGAVVRLSAVALTELHRRHSERFGGGEGVQPDIAQSGREPGTVRQLLRALPEADPPEQAAICFLLGVLRDPSTASTLTALLDAPTPVADAAGLALRGLGAPAEEQIRRGLREGDSRHRRMLLPLISDSTGGPDVVACLGDQDPDVRVQACDALARMGLVAEVGALFPLLGDRDARVSVAAVAAIQSLGSRETERLALAAAGSAELRVRRAALRILAYFGASSALDTFLTALRDPDERVRETAIQGLPFMEDPRAFEALLQAAKDPLEKTRAAAMRSLGQAADDLRAPAYLIKGLADPDPWVRYYACQSLGKLAFEAAVEPIVKLLDDPAGQVRVAAVEALSCLRGELAIAALERAATDADSDIRRAAIVGLGVTRHAAVLPLIASSLRSEDTATRLVAVSALVGFDLPEALSGLEAAASDQDESVRTAAVGFLAAMPGEAATRILISLLGTVSPVEPVLAALALPVEGRVSGLVSALRDADEETAPMLASALARMRRPDAVRALIDAMGLASVAARKAAASPLAVLASQGRSHERSKDALAALRKAASEDPDPQVRQICALLLSR